MKFKTISLFLFLGALQFQSCNREPDIKKSYRVAGFNSSELKKAMAHFRDDSIKLAAARFLISNMYIHYHYHDRQSDEVIRGLAEKKDVEVIFDSLFLSGIKDHDIWTFFSNSKRIFDAGEIEASVLIDHIEQAVNTWQNSPYATFISFDQFCELLLPLKTNGSEPVDWWTAFNRDFQWLKDSLEATRHPPYIISLYHNVLQREFGDYFTISKEPDPIEINSVFRGDCKLAAALETAVFRVCGLPTGHFYTPWANHHSGHHFAASLSKYGEWVIAQFYSSNEQNLLCRDKKIAKLFMWTYGKQAGSFMSFADEVGIPENGIPGPLRKYNMLDVTNQFIPVSNVTIHPNNRKPPRTKAVFLCFFSNPRWRAIDWATIAGDSASFENLGGEVIYLPMFYAKHKYLPAGDPFILTSNGKTRTIKPNKRDSVIIRLSRKYPIREPTLYQYAQPMINSVIELANDSSFTGQIFSYKITGPIQTNFEFAPENRDRLEYEMFWQSVDVAEAVPYRFLRYRSSPSTKCLIGEIEVLDDKGNKLTGRCYGSGPHPEYISDGVPGENYRDDSPCGWVMIDFGKRVTISRIRYIVAEDSNAVEIGDEYELYYWDDRWVSLGKQTAKEKILIFRGPANGLYWIRDLTKGEEERIFTYDDKPVWW